MKEKQHIVYFLGAGCSYNFGYPLTNQIMPGILKMLQDGSLFYSDKDKRLPTDDQLERDLLSFIKLAYPGLSDLDTEKEADRAPNITEIFSFVDHLCFYNTPHHPELNEKKLTEFKLLLGRSLGELVIKYERSSRNDTTAKGILHNRFIAHIKQQLSANHVTIITTNYDLSIDRFFIQEAENNEIDYGIPYRRVKDSQVILPPIAPFLRYYKLHGSLNWLTCSLCGYYYINPKGIIAHQEYRKKIDNSNRCICNKNMRLKAVLVAPSIVRDIRDSNLLQVWKGALEAIRTADKLVMIGYSMPAEDLAIKSIILRGLNGRHYSKPPQLEVVQYGQAAKPNYKNIFGSVFNEDEYEEHGLEAYLKRKNPGLFVS